MQIFNPTRHIELAGRVERRNARLAKKSEDKNAAKRFGTAAKAAAKIAEHIKAGALVAAYKTLAASKPMQKQCFDTWEVLSNMKERNALEPSAE
jgi:hypothetical protein